MKFGFRMSLNYLLVVSVSSFQLANWQNGEAYILLFVFECDTAVSPLYGILENCPLFGIFFYLVSLLTNILYVNCFKSNFSHQLYKNDMLIRRANNYF